MAATSLSTAAVSGNLMADSFQAGVVLCRSAKYTVAAEIEANSIIKMVPVPNGARIVRVDYKTSALGTGVTIDIGNAADIDAYVDGADASAAGTGGAPQDETLTTDIDVQIKILGAVCPAAAVLSCHVYYKMAANISDEG